MPPPYTFFELAGFGLIALVPSLLWLAYYLRKDDHPEPKAVIARLFVAGALLPPFVGTIEWAAQQWVVQIFSATPIAFGFLVGAAFLEETAKYLAALVIFYHNKEFDEPVDAMIYLIVVALGFAASENAIITISTAIANPSENLILLISLRFIGATLLHTLASGIVGYFIARSYFLREPFGLLRGLIFATLIHTFFNFALLQGSTPTNGFAPGFILFVLALLVSGLLVILADFRKLKHYGVSNLSLVK